MWCKHLPGTVASANRTNIIALKPFCRWSISAVLSIFLLVGSAQSDITSGTRCGIDESGLTG
jgi:hypothetical protein